MVLYILVYFACAAAAARLPDPGLAGARVEMTPDNAIQYLQFEDLSYNITDFTICAWIKFSNFSHTQTIFRLTGDDKRTAVLWRMHVRPEESMRVTINARLVASEGVQLARGRWNHVCFQWNGATGVWAVFVDAKIHSVGQTPAAVGNDTTAFRTHGRGTGVVGDDGVPCRNGWQAYGVYMAGGSGDVPAVASSVAPPAAASSVAPSATSTAASSAAATTAPIAAPSAANVTGASPPGGAAKNNSKRQAVFDSDGDDPTTTAGGSAAPKPFQWFSKTFAFLKRMFTFVIIPFFKFVRNTFFQTRSVDDTVVDVSETHLTVSDEKYEPPPVAVTTAATSAVTAAAVPAGDPRTADDDGDADGRRPSSASKRETGGGGGGGRCGADVADRVTAADLVAGDVAAGHELSPNARRYMRVVTDGLNDVGVSAAFVRRAYACCARPSRPGRSAAIVDWDRSRVTAHNVTVAPHVCGRQ